MISSSVTSLNDESFDASSHAVFSFVQGADEEHRPDKFFMRREADQTLCGSCWAGRPLGGKGYVMVRKMLFCGAIKRSRCNLQISAKIESADSNRLDVGL